MRVIIWVLAANIVLWTGFSAYCGDFYAQRSPTIPSTSNRDVQEFQSPEDLSSSCTANVTGQSANECGPEGNLQSEKDSEQVTSSSESSETDHSDEEITLLPNPEVQFVEDYMLKFDGQKSRDTIFYGGVVPFVAIPDTELSTDDRFFNDESFSLFFYLKRKF